MSNNGPAKMIARLGSRMMALFHRCRVQGLNVKLKENKTFPALVKIHTLILSIVVLLFWWGLVRQCGVPVLVQDMKTEIRILLCLILDDLG